MLAERYFHPARNMRAGSLEHGNLGPKPVDDRDQALVFGAFDQPPVKALIDGEKGAGGLMALLVVLGGGNQLANALQFLSSAAEVIRCDRSGHAAQGKRLQGGPEIKISTMSVWENDAT